MAITYDDDDLASFVLVVWRESRSEGPEGMDAVGHVIVNRVGAVGFPRTLHEVIYQKNAFTSVSLSTDPEYNLEPGQNDPQAAYIHAAAPTILANKSDDPTHGAHFYANLATMTSGWFFEHIVQDTVNHPHTVKIGHHDFYV